MAISRNLRRQRAKVRASMATTDAHNTAAFIAKQAVIRGNCAELGRDANKRGTGGISWLSPTRKPLGYTRNKSRGQLGTFGRELS